MGIVRINGYIAHADHEKYEKMKRALKDFADANDFSWLTIECEEKAQIKDAETPTQT
jgi:hypothetical protein